MRQWVWGLALTVGLSGCQLIPTVAGGNPATGQGGGATGREFPDTIQGLNFRDLSATGQGLIASGGGSLISSNGEAVQSSGVAAAPAAVGAGLISNNGGRPAPAAAGADMVARSPIGKVAPESQPNQGARGGAYSGNVWGGLGYGYYGYFGGSGEQMALVSAQEAELPGSKGGLQEIVNTLATPVLKNWASDARLVSTSATLGGDGLIAEGSDPTGPIGSPIGIARPAVMPAVVDRTTPVVEEGGMWSLTYNSTRRNEVLQFHVRRSKTTVIRLRWAPLQLASERVQTDSGDAIKRLAQAIKDKTFQSVEEKSGKDYFTGQPFEQPKTGQWDGDYSRTEVVYDVPAKARWNVSLEQSLGKLVWQLNFYSSEGGDVPVPMVGVAEAGVVSNASTAVTVSDSGSAVSGGSAGMIMPAPCDPSIQPGSTWRQGWFNNSGSGLVDAQTGAVIRFSRPTRSFYRDSSNAVTSVNCKPPVEPSPIPMPSASASATPGGSASSNGSN